MERTIPAGVACLTLIILIIVAVGLACSNGQVAGKVVQKAYEEKEDNSYYNSCYTMVDNVCRGQWVSNVDDEDWILLVEVCNEKNECKTKRVEVSNATWTTTEIGDWYGEASPSPTRRFN